MAKGKNLFKGNNFSCYIYLGVFIAYSFIGFKFLFEDWNIPSWILLTIARTSFYISLLEVLKVSVVELKKSKQREDRLSKDIVESVDRENNIYSQYDSLKDRFEENERIKKEAQKQDNPRLLKKFDLVLSIYRVVSVAQIIVIVFTMIITPTLVKYSNSSRANKEMLFLAIMTFAVMFLSYFFENLSKNQCYDDFIYTYEVYSKSHLETIEKMHEEAKK